MTAVEQSVIHDEKTLTEGDDSHCIACGVERSIAGDVVCESCSILEEYSISDPTVSLEVAADDDFEAELTKLEKTLLELTAELDTTLSETKDDAENADSTCSDTPCSQKSSKDSENSELSLQKTISNFRNTFRCEITSTPIAGGSISRQGSSSSSVADDLSDDSLFAEDRTLLTEQDEALDSDDDTLVPCSSPKQQPGTAASKDDGPSRNSIEKWKDLTPKRLYQSDQDESDWESCVILDQTITFNQSSVTHEASGSQVKSVICENQYNTNSESTKAKCESLNIISKVRLCKSEDESECESYLVLDQTSDFSSDSTAVDEASKKEGSVFVTPKPKSVTVEVNKTPIVVNGVVIEPEERKISCTPGGSIWIGVANEEQATPSVDAGTADTNRKIDMKSNGDMEIKVISDANNECEVKSSVDGISAIQKPQDSTDTSKPVDDEIVVLYESPKKKVQEPVSKEPVEEKKAAKPAFEYFVSKDPKENKDNDDPEWELLRKLETDEERYRVIRQRWRNLVIPDPNKDLTYFAYRRKHFPRGAKVPPSKNSANNPKPGEKRKHEAENTPPSKRQRTKSCVSVYSQQLDRLESEMNYYKSNVEREHQRRLLELSQTQIMQREALKRATYGDQLLLRQLYVTQLDEVKLLRSQYQASVNNLHRNYNNRRELLLNASNEVMSFHKFYNGLNAGNNTVLLSEKEVTELWDAEDIFENYEVLYRNN